MSVSVTDAPILMPDFPSPEIWFNSGNRITEITVRGRLLPPLHVGIKIGSPSDKLTLGPSIAHDLYRLRDCSRRTVTKFGKTHHVD